VTINITEASRQLFQSLAEDAGNWGRTPYLELTKEECGNLTQLKKAGLVFTENDDHGEILIFTEVGKSWALSEFGIEIL